MADEQDVTTETDVKVTDNRSDKWSQKQQQKSQSQGQSQQNQQSKQDQVQPTVQATPAVKQQAALAPVADPQVKVLLNYLEQYKVLCSTKVPTIKDRQAVIAKLAVIIRHVTSHPSKEMLDEMYKFFVRERVGLLAESVVFQAISSINTEQRLKMESFYTLFMALVRTKLFNEPFGLDIAACRAVLGNDAIVNYVASKLN
jgi:hypothetical protein